ncbi:MAG: hypothetical protein GC154_06310 [bacterium]|nr:hypothetical protein [bacterium]
MTDFEKRRKRNSDDHGQPEEWERLLDDVTVARDYHEATWNPNILAAICDQNSHAPLNELQIAPIPSKEVEKQLDAIRRIAMKKLSGINQQCILALMSTGAGPRRLAQLLRVSEDTVLRAFKRGVKVIRECLGEKASLDFPTEKGKRPVVRAAVMPLDLVEERERFAAFINERTIMHVSYRGDDLFREALVIYLVGKMGSGRRRETLNDAA